MKLTLGFTGPVDCDLETGTVVEKDNKDFLICFGTRDDAEQVVRAVNEWNNSQRALELLRLIINDLPTKRDWLDPINEAEARALLKEQG